MPISLFDGMVPAEAVVYVALSYGLDIIFSIYWVSSDSFHSTHAAKVLSGLHGSQFLWTCFSLLVNGMTLQSRGYFKNFHVLNIHNYHIISM
jgi:hypothetical protein